MSGKQVGSMIKTFLVHAVKTTQVSPGKGLITWLVTDENRIPRKVLGVTETDEQGFVKAVKPVYSRETPLVDALKTLVRGDMVTVDFRPFNLINYDDERLVYAPFNARHRFLLPRLSKLAAITTLGCALGIALVVIYHYL